jgi:segregation and condensation protein B
MLRIDSPRHGHVATSHLLPLAKETMLRTARSPARQLGSVCARFENPLALLAERAAAAQRRLATHCGEREQQGGSAPEQLRRLEAVLMLAREPLSSRKLSQFAGLADGTRARTLVRRLNTFYDEVGRAFRVEEVAGGFQLLTRPKFAPWLRRLGHVPPEIRLSSPAMETLAVVAYRQPVLRADIEAIRGVNCGEILRQLMERDLVRIGGRSEELGRPYLYTTTRRFLQVFGLRDAADLPRAELMREALAQPTASAEDQHLDTIETNNDTQPGQTEGGV